MGTIVNRSEYDLGSALGWLALFTIKAVGVMIGRLDDNICEFFVLDSSLQASEVYYE